MSGGSCSESSFGNSSFLIIPCMSDENVPPDSQEVGATMAPAPSPGSILAFLSRNFYGGCGIFSTSSESLPFRSPPKSDLFPRVCFNWRSFPADPTVKLRFRRIGAFREARTGPSRGRECRSTKAPDPIYLPTPYERIIKGLLVTDIMGSRVAVA
jgi:hypothetical protein